MLLCAYKAHAQTVTTAQYLQISKKIRHEKDATKKANLLYLAAFFYLEKEGDIQSNMDSVAAINLRMTELNKQLGSKMITARSQLFDAYITMETGDENIASAMFGKNLQYAHKYGLKREEANAYKALALNGPDNQIPENRKKFHKAISAYGEAGAAYEQAETLFALSITFLNPKEADSALRYASRSLKIKKKIKRYDNHKEYHTISQAFWIKGQYFSALNYGLEAEKIAENLRLGGEWPTDIYNMLGVIYAGLKYDDKSLNYFKKALEIVKKTNDTFSIERLTVNTASKLDMMKRPDEALVLLKELHYRPGENCTVTIPTLFLKVYCNLNKYDKAKPYFEQLQNCKHEKINNYVDRSNMYFAMINYLVKTGNANKAYIYIDELKKEVQINDDVMLRARIEINNYLVDSAAGHYLNAMKHLKMYKILSDSVYNLNSSKQLNELQLKYETNKKDKNIKLLTQQKMFQAVEIQSAAILRYVLIASLMLLVVFVALLHNRSRLKQRANKDLELTQQKINAQSDKLKKLLVEKEWLVKEIHHRVKNNLQVVISLLSTQSNYLKNDNALMAIRNSQNRMHAISLIHQKLYRSDNLEAIDMSWYIHELVDYLKESINVDEKLICVLDTESVKLETAQAVPLGLLLNEAISNSIAHAFAGKRHGQISISLKSIKNDIYKLVIADDGIGLPESFHSQQRESLGIDLMEGLANQLGATLELKNGNGLSVIVTFTAKSDLPK